MPKAQHPKAASFVRQNLFAGVMTFAEMESRVAALTDEQSRGDAFEVFAEAYLATQRKHDAAKVWPLISTPTQILQMLGLGVQDYGVDGVFQTLLGHLSVYQVKFRTNRPALTWRELSTFMGLADSPHIRSRVLLTNCDELPAVLNERQGFFCIRGSDLDRLEAEDFRAIEAWLADAAYTAPKKQPQQHQIEALDALLPALEAHSRVSAIMPCGTGKTLIALWVAERTQASRMLVLVPSLALLRQILHEWLRETSLPNLAYLCVCSDPTVKEDVDAIATAQSDLDFPVSTNSDSVREFLDASFIGPKVVFCTYHSAQAVGAALRPGEAFDLAVFDEAHKTAGREGRNHAFALEDANLPIRKRLFLTATPRHYNPLRRDREGDAQLVFSMDRPEVYGPQAYRLSFAEAVQRGIICGYKVLISVITSDEVTNELLNQGEVLVNGDAVRARQVANQIALQDAVEKYGASKVFTFHRTVASAASFVAQGNEGVRSHLPEFGAFHVNGTMPTSRRERVMRDFRAAARAVMSNARCLTEGVDVPAVDMVAFLSPKRSRVDIVQATGRAMRRSPGKATGYVLVPIYLEIATGESVDAAVQRTEFDEVWDVLQSLQEQDEVLAEIIRTMATKMGRIGDTGSTDDLANEFGGLVEFIGRSLSLTALRRAVVSHCLEGIFASWDVRFGELSEYRDQHGNCRVALSYKLNPQLAHWVFTQRRAYKEHKLSATRILQLEGLGFQWQPVEDDWQQGFSDLEAFRALHGHCDVPYDYGQDGYLSRWAALQRMAMARGSLPAPRREQLESLGFYSDPVEMEWSKQFAALVSFKARHGHCRLPLNYEENLPLGEWVRAQRELYWECRIPVSHISKLEALGFEWDQGESAWQENFAALEAFKAMNGHCRVTKENTTDRNLIDWVQLQRKTNLGYGMRPERFNKLLSLGFDWLGKS